MLRWEVNRSLGSRVWRGVEVEAFIAEVSGPLVGSLALVVGDRAVAEELAQDALVKAAIRWPTISTYDRPEAWVYRVAFNQARSWFRRRTAERRALQRVAAERPLSQVGPDEVVLAMVMREAVAGLPPRQREVVACRFYADLDVADTARVMDCAEGTVKSLTHRAVTTLRTAGLIEEVTDV